MRNIIVIAMISLDGVMQAPGGPEEDTSGGFQYGGWVAPYNDDISDSVLAKQMQPADYLLGRKTFEIWAPYWPKHADFWPAINNGTKYVFSNTVHTTDWEHTVFIKSLAEIQRLKNTAGSAIHVWGSTQLIQLLLHHDLVDELWLKIYPLTLGPGKKLFGEGTMPAAFTLLESVVTPKGVIIANYKRSGEVKTGSIAV